MALMPTDSSSNFFRVLIYNDVGQAWQSQNRLIPEEMKSCGRQKIILLSVVISKPELAHLKTISGN